MNKICVHDNTGIYALFASKPENLGVLVLRGRSLPAMQSIVRCDRARGSPSSTLTVFADAAPLPVKNGGGNALPLAEIYGKMESSRSKPRNGAGFRAGVLAAVSVLQWLATAAVRFVR